MNIDSVMKNIRTYFILLVGLLGFVTNTTAQNVSYGFVDNEVCWNGDSTILQVHIIKIGENNNNPKWTKYYDANETPITTVNPTDITQGACDGVMGMDSTAIDFQPVIDKLDSIYQKICDTLNVNNEWTNIDEFITKFDSLWQVRNLDTIPVRIVDTVDVRVTDTVDVRVTDTVDVRVTDTVDVRVTDTVDVRVTDTVDVRVTDTVDVRVTDTVDVRVTDTLDVRVTDTVDVRVTDTVDVRITDTVDVRVTDTLDVRVTDTVDVRITDTVDVRVTDTVDVRVTDTVDVRVTDTVDVRVTDTVDVRVTDTVDVRVTDTVDVRVTDTVDVRVTDTVDVRVTDTVDVRVTDTVDVRVTDTVDVRVTDTVDVRVTDTVDVRVTDTVDVRVTDTVDVRITDTLKVQHTIPFEMCYRVDSFFIPIVKYETWEAGIMISSLYKTYTDSIIANPIFENLTPGPCVVLQACEIDSTVTNTVIDCLETDEFDDPIVTGNDQLILEANTYHSISLLVTEAGAAWSIAGGNMNTKRVGQTVILEAKDCHYIQSEVVVNTTGGTVEVVWKK